jgi:hypothetical protein
MAKLVYECFLYRHLNPTEWRPYCLSEVSRGELLFLCERWHERILLGPPFYDNEERLLLLHIRQC